MHLTPLYEKIVVDIDGKQELETEAGLTITLDMSSSKNTTMKGTVVAVGDGRLLQDGTILPLKVKTGDKVIFSKMQGESYTDGNKEYTILSESSILAIVKEEENEDN